MQAVVECGKHDAAVAAASHMCVKVQGIKRLGRIAPFPALPTLHCAACSIEAVLKVQWKQAQNPFSDLDPLLAPSPCFSLLLLTGLLDLLPLHLQQRFNIVHTWPIARLTLTLSLLPLPALLSRGQGFWTSLHCVVTEASLASVSLSWLPMLTMPCPYPSLCRASGPARTAPSTTPLSAPIHFQRSCAHSLLPAITSLLPLSCLQGFWTCSHCTFNNADLDSERCEMCEEPRGRSR